MDEYDYLFKLSIIGDSSVGKSSLLLKYSDDIFDPYFNTTIGVDFRTKILEIEDKKFKLQIWDTSGQQRFKAILNFYIGESNGIIIMYDITNRISFNNITSWLRDIDYETAPYIPVVIVGNKTDIISDRVVTYEEASKFAKEYDIQFVEISVKENENIDKVFTLIAKEMKNNFINNRDCLPFQKHKKYKNIKSNNILTCCSSRKSKCTYL
jgi:Ras-related protein Rab-1A